MDTVRLLDLTRLLSRSGKGPMTGVDRVEAAYLDHLLVSGTPVFGLVRSAVGYLLLDPAGMRLLRDGQTNLLKPDLIGRLAYRGDPIRARSEATLRRVAIARCWRGGLARLLRRHFPQGGAYLNVGHANLDARCFRQLLQAGFAISVLVHDTIPLDHPEFARPDTVEPFRRKMAVVARLADQVIYSSQDARLRAERQFARLGRVPKAIVAPLGVPQPLANAAALPLVPQTPYFVCLGTIEPRKNHQLLLDVWARLPDPVPHLYIVGRRGWFNAAVFAQLDVLPQGAPIHELAGLSDSAVAALLAGAQALLFPSFAEGYGLPAVEAAALGTPVIASDLAVFRETLKEYAVYLDPSDSYSWLETILAAARSGAVAKKVIEPPNWQDHFRIVFCQM